MLVPSSEGGHSDDSKARVVAFHFNFVRVHTYELIVMVCRYKPLLPVLRFVLTKSSNV